MSAFIFTNDRSDGSPSVPDAVNNAQFRLQLWRRTTPSGNGSSTSVYLWDDTVASSDATYLKWKPIGNYISASDLTALQSGSNRMSIASSGGNVYLDVVETNISINNTSGTLIDSKLSSNVALKDSAQTFAQPVTFTGGMIGDVTGNATSASKWATARSVTLTGDATGTVSNIDGTSDISIATTVNPAAVGNTSAWWNANLLQGNPISTVSPASNNALIWNGSQWVATTLELDTLDDCVIVNPQQGEVLRYNGVSWSNSDIDIGSILGAAIIISSESWLSADDKIASTSAIHAQISSMLITGAPTQLKMSSSGGITSSLSTVQDGEERDSTLQLSTLGVKSTGTMAVSGMTTLSDNLRLEDDADGEYFGIATPSEITASYTLTVPPTVGSSGQALRASNSSGVLEWFSPDEVGDITSVTAGTNLNGGGSSGDVTLNLDTAITGLDSVGIGTSTPEHALTVVSANDSSYDAVAGFYTNNKSVGVEIHNQGIGITNETADGSTALDANTNFKIDARGTGHVIINTTDGANVGIGTAAPSKALHVVGGSGDAILVDNKITGAGGYLILDTESTGELVVRTAGSHRMSVNSTGVGIGTDAPNARLEVEDGGTSESVVLKVTADDQSIYSLIVGNDTYSTTDTDGIGMWINNAGVGKLHAIGAASELAFGTVGVDRMQIDSSGNVGIGTASPSYPLEIANGTPEVALEDTSSGGSFRLKLDGTAASITNYSSNGNLTFGTAGTGDFVFSTGNVGIGTTAPSTKLEVVGGIKLSGLAGGSPHNGLQFDLAGSSDYAIVESGTDDVMRFGPTNANGILHNISSGNVGLGTVSPSAKLHAVIDSDTDTKIRIENSQGASVFTQENAAGGKGLTIETTGVGSNIVLTPVSDTIISQGNVDIGTSGEVLGGKLNVGDRGSGTCDINLGIDDDNRCMLTYTNTDKRFSIGTRNAGTAYHDAFNLVDGNVGIGTTGPTEILHLYAGGSPTVLVEDSTNNCKGILKAKDDNVVIGAASNHILHLATNNTNKVTVLTDGNVGIGTAAPSEILHLYAGGSPTVLVEDTTNNCKGMLKVKDDNVVVGAQTNHILHLATNNTNKVTVLTDGNVGIGTAAPAYPIDCQKAGAAVSGDWYDVARFIEPAASKGIHLGYDNGEAGVGIIAPSGGTSKLAFWTHDGSAWAERFRFSEDGALGIGSTPSYGTSGQVLSSGGDSAPPTWLDTGTFGSKWTDSGSSTYLTNTTDNVGIGTSSPEAKLSVAGSTSTFVSTQIRQDGVGDASLWFSLGASTLFSMGVDNDDADSFKISSGHLLGTNDRLTIDTSGNVGIGTAAPSVPLHISTAPSGGLVKFEHTGVTIADGSAILEVRGRDDSDPAAYDLLNLNNNGTVRMVVEAGGDVGIGTASPDHKLHVNGNIGTGTYGTTTTGEGFRISSTAIIGQTSAADKVKISGTAADSWFLNNVGIGTTSPTASLEINQTAATRGFQVIRNVDQVNTEALAYFTDEHPTSTQATVRIRNDGTGDALQVMDAASPALIVDGSGFVGIGAASPAQNLHVNGTNASSALFESSASSTWIQLKAASSVSWQIGATSDGIQFYSDETAAYTAKFNKDGNVTFLDNKKLQWGDAGTNIQGSSSSDNIIFTTDTGQRMTIDNTGVGIGTTAPSAKLHVAGDSRFEGTMFFPATSNSSHLYINQGGASASPYIAFHRSDGYRLGYIGYSNTDLAVNLENSADFVVNGGNVGIGTTAPSSPLHVAGTTNDGNSLANFAQSGTGRSLSVTRAVTAATRSMVNFVQGATSGDTNAVLHIQQSNEGEVALGINSDGTTTYGFSVTDGGEVYAAGSVGIGTAAPSQKLSVVDATPTILNQSSAGDARFYAYADGGDAYMRLTTVSGVSNDWAVGTDRTDGYFKIADNSTLGTNDRLIIDTSGNVGIGTASPNANSKLEIAGRLRIGDGSAALPALSFSDSGDYDTGIYRASANVMGFSTAGSERMRIDTNGNVGIGTASPATALHVAAGHLTLDTNYAILWEDGNNLIGGSGSSGSNSLNFNTNGVERLRINSSGNVGIGTAAPADTLTVAGTVGIDDYINHNGDSDTYIQFTNNNLFLRAGGQGLMLDGTGNVGIGTSSPTTSINSGGSPVLDVSGTQPVVTLHDTGDTGEVAIGYNEAGGLAIDIAGHSDATKNDILFRTGIIDDDYTVGTRMAITSAGYVGIGTAAPATTLEVVGPIRSSGTSRIEADVLNNGANSANIIHRSGTSTLVGNGNYTYITDAGSVGIGTASPSSLLHATQTGANGDYLAYLYNSNSGTTRHGLNVQIAATDIGSYGLRVNTGGDSNALAVMGDGNVGIGDATPTYKLDVNGTFRTTGAATFDGSVTATTFTGNVSGSSGSCTGNAATVTTNANLTGHITSSGSNATTLGSFTVAQLSTALSDATLSGSNTGDQTNITGNAATVTTNANLTGDVTSSGNATTIATDAVDIAMLSATGTASSSTFLRGDNTWTAVSGGAVSAVANGADNRLATFSSSDALNGEVGLLFDGTNLGVGATPNSYTNYTALTVNGVNAGGSLLDMEVNSVLTYELAVEASQVTHNAVTNVPMVFKQNNTERMRIDATGVGIGTTAPATTLELASTDPVIRLNDAGAISEISGDGGNLAIGAGTVSSSDKVLTLSVQGVERMRINPGGNIQTPTADTYDVMGGSFTYNIDFSDTNLIRLNLTDDGVTGPTSDLTLTTSNREAGRTKRIYIKGMDAAMLTEITEPGWAIFGVDMTSLSSYDMILDMTCWGDDDADITVQAVEQTTA